MENGAWAEESGAGFDFKYYGKRYLRLWPLLLIAFAVCFGYAYYYLRFKVVSSYRSSTKVMLSSENYSAGMNSGINLMMWGGQKNVANEIAIFRTSYLMEQLVKKQRLNVFWYQIGRLREVEVFDVPMELETDRPADSLKGVSFDIVPLSKNAFELIYTVDAEEVREKKFFGQVFSVPGGDRYKLKNSFGTDLSGHYRVKISPVEAAASRYNGALSVGMDDRSSSIVILSFTYPLASKAAYILNEYVKEFTYQNDKDKTRIADSTINFIDYRISRVNEDLLDLEDNIQRYMQEKGLANLDAQSGMLLGNQNSYNQQLIALENRLSLIKALQESLTKTGASPRIVPGSLLDEDGGFASLAGSYNDLIMERERMLLSYKEDHPVIVNHDTQIEEARLNILEYLQNTENRLLINRRDMRATANVIAGDIRQVPQSQREVLDMERKQQLAQSLYLFLLQRREETAVANSARGAGIRVIEPAKRGIDLSTNPNNYWMMAFVIALLVPAAKIAAEELLNSKVRNRKDINKRTAVPIIAEISHMEEDYTLIDFLGKRSALAEQFRSLRTDLAFMLTKEGAKVVMLTSGMPGEGKSFTAINLAHVLAYAGKKVLLMEFDLRRPKLSSNFKLRDKQLGITNYIIDRSMTLEQLAYKVHNMESLYYIGSGPIPPNPSELISNDRTMALMNEAKEQYDLVIIDTPPIGMVTDAQLLNRHADATLYMVRANHTPLDLVKLIEELDLSGKMSNMGIVFNDVAPDQGGYYGYYGYGYGYYGEEEEPKSKKGIMSRFKENKRK